MNAAHLPTPIVAVTSALGTELSQWAGSHPDAALADLETAALTAVRAALPALLRGMVQATQQALTATAVRCPCCAHAALVRDWRTRQVLTSCGVLRWERRWAYCPTCGASFGAGDAALGLRAYQQQSAGLQAMLVSVGGACAFGEATRLLRQLTGLAVSPETVRRVTEAAGTSIADAQDAATAVYAAGAEPPVTDPAPGVLVAETDGVMVRYLDGWHEAKVGVVGGWVTGDAGGGRLQQQSYVAAREESSAFAWRWGAAAAQRGALTVVGWQGAHHGVAALRHVVVLGDGAHWIWDAAATQFGERTEIVDYYHACEHLTAVAEALYGAQTPAAQAWAERQRGVLLAEGVDAVLPHVRSPGGLSTAATETLRRERGFFTANQARMHYPSFRAQGLPIGSGAIESSAKHVVQQRLKRPGARWSEPGGRALLALRAHQASAYCIAA